MSLTGKEIIFILVLGCISLTALILGYNLGYKVAKNEYKEELKNNNVKYKQFNEELNVIKQDLEDYKILHRDEIPEE